MGKLVKEENLITRNEIVQMINLADNQQKKAFISIMFLSGARVMEVIPLRKRNFQIKELDGIEYLIVVMKVLKKRKRLVYRKVPISMNEELTPYITEYIKPLNNDDKLFPNWYEKKALRMYQKLGKEIGKDVWNHLIRHTRLTELSEDLDFDSLDLVKFTGWSDARPATIYVHTQWKSLARKLNKS